MLMRLLIVSFLLGLQIQARQQSARAGQDSASFEISGVLVDALTGQPLSKAKVAIAPVTKRGDFTVVTTGEDGRFSFGQLSTNKYTLSAQRRGYLTQAFHQHENFSSSIAVGPGIDSTHLIFPLAPECAISGAVLDEAGEPVRDAQVMLYQTGIAGGSQGTRLRTQAISDDQGSYRFGHLAPGRYIIAVSARVWYAQRPQPKSPVLRTTFSGERPHELYAQTQAISGKLEQADTGSASPLDVVYPITFYPASTDPSAATPITLKDGEKFVADVTLQPVSALRLQLTGEGTNATQNRFVTLERKLFDGSTIPVIAETRISASGAMEVVGIPPGQYTVKVIDGANPRQPTAVHEISAVESGPVVPLDVQGSHVTATVQLDPGAPRPAQSFLQIVNTRTHENFNERIPEKGELEYKQTIPPGTYEIALTNGAGTYIRSVAATGAKVSGRNMELKGAAIVKVNIALAHGQGQVTGTALRDGKPFAGAMVVLVPADPANNAVLFRRDQSDSDGTFTLGAAIPGKYTVVAMDHGWDLEWMNPRVLKPYLAQGTPVEIQPNGKYDVKVNVQ